LKSAFLRIVEILFVGLLLFGLIGLIASISEPDIGMPGIIVFSIWCLISLFVFIKAHKARKKLKGIKTKANKKQITHCKSVESVSNNSEIVRINQNSALINNRTCEKKIVHNEKVKIKPEDLNCTQVIQRYLTTDHSTVPSIYDYYGYYHAEFACMLNNIPKCNIRLSTEKVLRNKELLTPFEKSAIITTKTTRAEVENFVVVDTETTGIRTGGNDIVEISAIKFENFTPVSAFSTLLKPRKPIPEDATRINGITDEMVKDAPSFAQIKSALETFIGNYPVVAHNAAFDVKFLHVSGMNFSDSTVFFDTLELSRKHIRDCLDGTKLENYKLATVCEECGIYFSGAHRSMADALATGLLFIEIVKTVFEEKNVFAIQFSDKPLLSLNELEDWEYYQQQKPVKTFTVTSRDEYDDVYSYSVGDEVEQGFDIEKDKDTLEINYSEICNMPKSAQTFFEENCGDYRMFVLDVYEADNGKVKIKVGIYKEK